jgi:type VI secretion system secreted protein VgrG
VSNDRSVASGKAKEYEDAKGYADTRIREAEADVFVISGISKNPTFIPGTVFRVDADLTKREPIPANSFSSFLLRWVKSSAYELNYDFLTIGAILGDVWDKSTSQFKVIDASMNTVAQGLQEWMQNYIEGQIEFDVQQLIHLDSKFWLYTAAGGLSYALTSAMATGGSQLLHDLLDRHDGFSNSFVCSEDARFMPLPKGIKPKADGPHLGVVIGPNQLDELDTSQQDVFADALGRVRVRFPWDKSNFQLAEVRPAAWVKVSEAWASRTYGTQFLPRIGDEVIVEFIDGDPDRPIITGRVYNARLTGATNLPFPDPRVRSKSLNGPDDYVDLPKTAPTGPQFQRSGIKTMSTPRPRDAKGHPTGRPRYHLLRFDDTWHKEQYLIRSQGQTDVTTFGSYFDTTGGDRHLTIGGPNGGGNLFVKMFGEYDIHVVKSRFEQIDQNYEMQVTGNTSWMFDGNRSTYVGGIDSVMAGGSVLSATTNITLMVGASSIVITPAAISITSPVINLVAPSILSTVPVVPAGAASLPPLPPSPVVVGTPTDPSGADPGEDDR